MTITTTTGDLPRLADALRLAEAQQAAWPAITARITQSGAPTNLVDTTKRGLADRLKRIESDLAEARDERKDKVAVRDAAREAFANAEGAGPGSPEFKAAKAAVRDLGACDDRIAALRDEQVSTLRLLGRDAPSGGVESHAAHYLPNDAWSSTQALNDPAIREALQRAATSTMPVGRIALGQVASRDEFAAGLSPMAADVSGTDNMRRGSYYGVVPELRRQLRVLDLIPAGTMDGASVPYTRESGSFDTAAETAEGDTKPEAGVTYTDADADAVTIAHWLKIRKQTLADVSAMRSTIDGRLRYGVERRLEAQALAGNGTGANLKGILNTPGIGTVAYDADELVADQVLRGLTTVLLADAQASGIVMNPSDWQTALIAKAAGDGHYYSGGPYATTPASMWGVPVIASTAIPAGTVLVGDFALGAQLFIREGVQTFLSDSDQDDFITNKVTLLAEMRAALAVWRPAAFCTVDLSA